MASSGGSPPTYRAMVASDAQHTLVVPTLRIQLVDDAGNGVANQPCLITGPDDFRYEALTNREGRVLVVAQPDAQYEVCFTHLDADAWGPADR